MIQRIFLVIIIFAFSQTSSGKTAYMGIAIEASMPFVEVDSPLAYPKIKRGILKDFGRALAAETGFSIEIVPLPLKRMGPELAENHLSFICYTLEEWLPAVRNQVLWSDVIYHNQNLLVSLDPKPLNQVSGLHHKRVGLVVNFYYPNLEEALNKFEVFRETGPDNESNLRKLKHGRIDYVVLSSLEFQYQQKLEPRLRGYNVGMDHFGVKCAVSKKSPLSLAKLNAAIAAMRKNGTLEKVFHAP